MESALRRIDSPAAGTMPERGGQNATELGSLGVRQVIPWVPGDQHGGIIEAAFVVTAYCS